MMSTMLTFDDYNTIESEICTQGLGAKFGLAFKVHRHKDTTKA